MPVTVTEFLLIALPYIVMLFLPYFAIRKLSADLGKNRNKFEIISAVIFYPFVFIFASYSSYFLQKHYESGIIIVYFSFIVAFILAFLLTWAGHKYVIKNN